MRLALLRLTAVPLAACLLPASSSALLARYPYRRATSNCVRRGFAAMAASGSTSLVWYKASDLRVNDHEPLVQAHRESAKVLHVFCFDPRWFGITKRGTRRMSPIRCLFLLESITDLQARLRAGGSDLVVLRGHPEDILPDLLKAVGGSTIYTHTDVCSEETDVHTAVQKAIQKPGSDGQGPVSLKSFWGNTIHRIQDLPFKFPGGVPEVFTQFRKSVEQRCREQPPLQPPDKYCQLPSGDDVPVATAVPTVEELGLEAAPERDSRSVLPFHGGETAGLQRVQDYIFDEDRLRTYKKTRNGLLGQGFSTKFSPWLAHGCLSPRSIVSEVRRYENSRVANQSTYWLLFELLWRDFFRYSAVKYGNNIFHLGGPRRDAGRQRWSDDRGLLEAWKRGQTGYPFVDANMRELKASGFMSNRGRQVVASFFTKDMAMDWRLGAEHFEEYLLDYDPSSNWGNWNYVAGVGSDPREDRYFNIEKQAKTYDADAGYIRHWLPELAALPTTALQTPRGITTMLRHMHTIPTSVYPDPVVPLKFAGPGKQGGRGSRGGGGRSGDGGRDKRGRGSSGGGRSKTFKSARIQNDYMS